MGDSKIVGFYPLDRDAEIAISHRKLPHWFQVNAAVFVTFRTADSLPRDVVLRMQQDLQEWLEVKKLPKELTALLFDSRRSTRAHVLEQLSDRDRREFRRQSDTLFHRALDECHGACPLKRPELARIAADAILHGNGTKFDLDSFVVMPNHVHAIVQFRTGFDFSIIGQSWMRYSARMINQLLGASGAFWQPEPFDHLIRSAEQFVYLQNYIASNPRKSKLSIDEFLFWKRERK